MSAPEFTREDAKVIGAFLVVLAVLLVLAGFWWWALFGLSEKVGVAGSVTAGALLSAGIVIVDSAK